jgi:peptidoglycan/xylan/chitin deacetylase (PgdA/CDA1 family)
MSTVIENARMHRAPLEWLCLALRATLIPRLVRELVQRRRVTILLYHRPRPASFAAHVRLLEKAYNLIPLSDLMGALERRTLADLPPKPLVISFDDGHRSNYELIDILRELPASPTIFLCSGIVGTDAPYWFDLVTDPEPLKRVSDETRLRALAGTSRIGGGTRAALDGDEIEALKPYVDFQSHTVSHPILPRCDADKAFEELSLSRAQLERAYDLDVYALAYPNGDYSDRELLLARRAGYRCAVTVEPGFNGPAADPFRLRRIPVDDDRDGPNTVLLKACGIWGVARAILHRRGRPARDRIEA